MNEGIIESINQSINWRQISDRYDYEKREEDRLTSVILPFLLCY